MDLVKLRKNRVFQKLRHKICHLTPSIPPEVDELCRVWYRALSNISQDKHVLLLRLSHVVNELTIMSLM